MGKDSQGSFVSSFSTSSVDTDFVILPASVNWESQRGRANPSGRPSQRLTLNDSRHKGPVQRIVVI